MLTRRDVLQGLAASPLGLAYASAQTPAKGQRKGVRGGLAAIEELFDAILKDYEIVGGSLAIAKDGRLVLARGVGMADSEAKKPVTPQTLFSIASVTKPVSAIAILKLVELGKLKLDARLIDLLDDIKPLEGSKAADPRFKQITIHQILYHGSGLAHDTPAPGKGKGKKNDADDDDDDLSTERQVEIYRNALSQPLDFAPGSDHKYSNVAYALLQLVIARVTGQPYEKWVQANILEPMGITRMVMETESFLPAETKRYGRGPNGVRSLAGHRPSNWLATPTDMVRFLTVVAETRGKPILSERHHKLMLAVPPSPIKPDKNGRHVGLGWDSVQPSPEGPRYSKNGGKNGVRAWLEHLPNGVDWAFLFNTSDLPALPPQVPPAMTEISRRIAEALLELKRWPDVDLFKAG